MPNTRSANAVRLEFAPASLVQANLSGAAFSGDELHILVGLRWADVCSYSARS